MQTIKTFVVVALLITVCYGAFVALNAPDVSIPEELEQWANAQTEKELKEFEIPSLSLPEPFSPSLSEIGSEATAPGGLPSNEFVGFSQPSSAGLSSNDSPPQFPAFDQPFQSIEPPPSQFAQTDSGAQALSLPPQDTPTSPWPAESSNAAPSSGAMLTSVPNSFAPSNLATNDGPSIPFNPDLPLLDDSAINDLISAGGMPEAFPQDAPSGFSEPGLGSTASVPLDSAHQTPAENNSVANSVPASPASASVPTSNSGSLEPNLSGSSALPKFATFAEARSEALTKAQAGNLAEALETLSQYYDSPELTYAEHTDLVDLLDALSREVIYSDRSLLGPAHNVAAQDTLQSLAEKHHINPELLAAINKMGETQALVPNSRIKVLEGPFRAQLSLSRGELTVFLRKYYAGRFPVSISKVNKPALGTFEIVDRRKDRTYYGASAVIPAGAPTNPYGGYWLSLGSNLSIHGSPEQVTTDLEGAGCISLSPLDAADIYRILSKGSAVEIRQ